ncbi:MAG: 2-oxoacid:ferredoxin oxidoreductase subunit beta [Anaerolineae bacterium]|nr:2-oxoacid:ferredoxin oxidoreductase subunit beta [Anaerolineae bacterium]NIN97557.1 2-oxoacid:ferredoxin oxidoreductase subunit beta [Anaerolineae bacterium]NIQ80485.1 2-oxoacid:ferredoxin oxidoreductase subunit beta [Anaerolineae bacterium]
MGEILREKYLRQPTPFCAGCGHGIFMNAFLRAVEETGLDFGSTVFVSGIGCGAWVPSPHFRADTLHVTHGRAIAFATGVKLTRPELDVIVISGDGDLATIGGNHLIHAARRNVPIKVFCLNNLVYGMTGGQVSATTPQGDITSTTPQGNPERAFDLVALAQGAGAPYVARFPVVRPRKLTKGIINALRFDQFAFVDVLSLCPTEYGRANRARLQFEGPSLIWSMLEWQKRACVEWEQIDPEDTQGRIPVGEWYAES